jgi:hypothetical protein
MTECYFRALEKEPNLVDYKRTLVLLIYLVVIYFEETLQNKVLWDNKLNNMLQMES